ncbi:MAG TPA: hypothetical protein VK255_01740 [Patescibacteria group bacterium]|nr:hypothetical protein [Patescibacteria group bacterium]
MTIRAYIWINRLLSLFSFALFGIIVTYVSPDDYGWQGKVAFYLIFGLFLSSFFGQMLIFLRRRTLETGMEDKNAILSMRQGLLLALLAVILLVLQSFRVLVWWDGLLVVAGVFLVELYFLSRSQ